MPQEKSKQLTSLKDQFSPNASPKHYAFVLASCGLFYGYGLGLFNSFFVYFISTFGITDEKEYEPIQTKFSLFFVGGGTIACLFSSFIYDSLGRYKSILLTFGLEFLIVALMFVFHSIPVYYGIRLLSGFVGAFSTFLFPLIIDENLPESLANSYGPFFTGMISLGIIINYSFCFSLTAKFWRLVVLTPIVSEIPKFIFFTKMRMESPAWLASKGASIETLKKNYLYLYEEDIAYQLAKDIKDLTDANKNENSIPFKELLKSDYRLQFLLAFLLNMLNQLTGGGLLELYSTSIFEKAGLPKPAALTIILGFCSGLAGIYVFYISKIIGMRNMLISGLTGQSVGYFIFIAATFYDISILVALGIFLSYFSYCISLGGVLFSYNTKILPPVGLSVCAAFQWALGCLLTWKCHDLMNWLKPMKVFFGMQVFATLGGIIFIAYSINVEKKSKETIKDEFKVKTFFS